MTLCLILLFTAGTATVGVTHQLGWLITSRDPWVTSDGASAARRAQSTNNLKQIGLALHNYHSSNEAFPGVYGARNIGNPSELRGAWGAWSAQSLLLPYFEQSAIHNACNFMICNRDGAAGQTQNQTAIGQRINSFLCPSSPLPPGGSGDRAPAEPATEGWREPQHLAVWEEFHERAAALPDEEGAVFDLIWYNGLSQAEAAEVLNVSLSTVKRRWQAARLRLIEAFGGTSPFEGSSKEI